MKKTFFDRFKQMVTDYSEKPAIVFEGNHLSYAQLDKESDQIAEALSGAGVGRSDIVPILLDRGIGVIAAMLGVLKSGAAICNIDTSYPAERISFIIRDASAKLIIDDAFMQNLNNMPKSQLKTEISPDDIALVVYTSGSTGNPKGVLLSHQALNTSLDGTLCRCGSDDSFLLMASLSFIGGITYVFSPISAGMTIHLASDTVRKDVARMIEYIKINRITATFFPPQLAKMFLEKGDGLLRILMTGGEKVRSLYSENTRIFNVYGASETFALVTCFPIDKPYENGTPIGKAVSGVCVHLLDDNGNAVSAGDVGEICISGQIAKGYLNLPEQTSERFITYQGSTLFKTGDLGRLLGDGNIEYVQRKDWMMKIRGFRVEPGEIEAAIKAHPKVTQAVVVGFQNSLDETALYGVYTAKEQLDPLDVEKFIGNTLPDYMMPAFIEQIESMPLNQNGKIDRRSIKPPTIARFQATYEPPQSQTEEAICEAFGKVLGVARVGALDNFSLLGGDSMSAVKLQSELSDFGFSAIDFLTLHTPRALATLAIRPIELPKATPRDSYPLTFPERQMATEQHMNSESVAYNVNLALEINGMLDIPKLEQALNTLVNRHSAFRSYYPMENGEIVHRVTETIQATLQQASCSADEVQELIQKSNKPYDLSHAPLFRFNLYKTGENSFVFHLSCHHIIIDGASGAVMFDELWRLYSGEELSPLTLDYNDYAVYQSENNNHKEGEAFFTDMFAGGVPENEMPTKPKRPDVLPFADTDCSHILDFEPINNAAKKYGVSAFRLLFAAAGLTLAKYCGSEDVSLGTAMSGRSHPQTANMVGMFVNTLPVRVKTPGDMSAEQYIGTVAETIGNVKKHETFPFEKIVPILAPDRNTSRSPIFDCLVNYLPELEFPHVEGITIRELPIKRQALAMDLMLEFLREGDKLRIVLSYSRDLYDDQVIQNMMEQLCVILSRFTEGNGTLSDIAQLPETQHKQITEDFAGEKSCENLGKTLVDLFREQVKKTPQNRAVAFSDKALTYEQLDNITEKIAAYLGKQDGAVGILVNRSEMMPACALGVMKSGAAYLPLDPGYPAERLEFMIEDAGVSVVIADEHLKDRIPNYSGDFLLTKDIANLQDGKASLAPKPQDTMILLYTSGTTGKPKGVMLSHGNLVNFCTWYKKHLEITEKDNISAYASFGFDANMMDMYPTLIAGACVHIIPEEMRLDLPSMREYFSKNSINIAFITTQLGRQFAEGEAPESLRALLVGGESLVPIEPSKNYTLYNVYGPTECTVFATQFPVDRLYDRVPIGRAIANVALYVVDKNNGLAPVGVAGELCIAGRQVAKGYLNRPDITEEKFIKNPFSSDPDYAVMYRTGDVVRFLPDGNIDFVGRSDFQIKIRGFRVELTEIEERIRAFSQVKDAAVVAADAPGGGKCAVAYIVGDNPIEIEAINRFIEEELPPYMVPTATMQIDKIPLNQNGKVDRRKLPAPVFTDTNSEQEQSRPLNDLETQIFKIAADVLGHEQLGITTNLLRSGLSSLSAIKFATRLDDAFGVSPSVRDIMKSPTILDTENAIISLLLTRKPQEQEAREQQHSYPLSNSQMGVYLDCLKNPASISYNVPFMLSLPMDMNAQKLCDTVCKIIDAHPAVKARISENMMIPTHAPATVAVKQMSEGELYELREHFSVAFDLEKGPLYRAIVVKTPERTALLADFHHIVFDGGSLDIFLREIGAVYDGGTPFVEKLSAFDAALAESEREGSDAWQEDKAYFDRLLSDFEEVSEIEPDVRKDGVGTLDEIVKKADRTAVEAFCKSTGTTPAAVFLAATAYAVSRFTQKSSAYISGISSGRSDVRLTNTFGMFVRTLPLVVKSENGQSCLSYIQSAGQMLSETTEHEGYPYTKIAQDYGYSPSIMYTCQLGVVSDYSVGGANATLIPLALEQPKFKLSVHIEERGEDFVFAVQYNDGFYSKALMEQLAGSLTLSLSNMLKDPSAPVSSVSLMSSRQKLLIDRFNKTGDQSKEGILHRLFETAVANNPDKIALIAEEGSYTYTQLNAEANKVANGLLEKGVQKEDRIALLLKRTGRVLIAMLGALKAGCAYIPLDPDYPEERIAHVLSDSGAKLLLKEQDVDSLREGQSDQNPNIDIAPNNLAYIIYTSGSTGKPKGVMIEHRGIANYVNPHPSNIHVHALVKQASRMMSITTVAFDMFLKESMTSLCNGLTLVFASENKAHDPAQLAKLFSETGADAFNTTPSVMMEYTEHPALLTAIRQCKIIMCGAEKYPDNLLQRLRGEGRLFNTYGPTEITVSCNAKELTTAERVTVGKPLLNVCEQVMDGDGNPLPIGVIGELWVGGAGVARGYVNLPEQTAERFVTYNGIRMYKTGDYARWTADGEIEILGRSDSQIKLRGLRIELGEVENALFQIDGIRSCAVVIRKIQNSDHLCAFYTADKEIAPEELREQLKKTLTGYMLPTAYLQLCALPKTPGGKTDYRALPTPALLGQGNYEPPQGETEQKLCDIFAQVVGFERVGAVDNFFEIGGTSLAVTRLVIAAEAAGLANKDGQKISYSNVFANPTPRGLANILLSGKNAETEIKQEDKYDYSDIHALLTENNLDAFRMGGMRKMTNVLLTGATGFLGIHMLHSLLQKTDGTIYCLARRSKQTEASKRVRSLLFYYFEDAQDYGDRLKVIEGDMTDPDCLEQITEIDTIINCAANVTHFAKDSRTFDVNIGGVKNLIDICKKQNARLIHISTASIAGLSVGGYPSKDVVMDETMLFFGQNLENGYIHSKFMAERAILEAALTGLDAKIMRVGNLMARNKDGEFQINAKANSFLGRLRAYHTVGCYPYSAYHSITELAPIDSTVSAILRLAGTSGSCRVYHPYNNHNLFMGDIILTMKDLGISIEMVEGDVFKGALSRAMKDPACVENLTGLIAYQNMAQGKAAVPVAAKCDYTTQTLLRLGWRWPETDSDYLRKFLEGLIGLGIFGGGDGV